MRESKHIMPHRHLIIFGMLGIMAGTTPSDAHAWAIIDNLKKIVGSNSCGYTNRCYTPTAIAGIRGSDADIIQNPDGSETWTINQGDFDFTLRSTGEQISLHAGDTYTFAKPESPVLPTEYRRLSTNVGTENLVFQPDFQKVVDDDLFNVSLSLTSSNPDFPVVNGHFLLGNLTGKEVFSTSQYVTLPRWNEVEHAPFFSWYIEYDDKNGIHHGHHGLPFLPDALMSIVAVPEPGSLSLMAMGLLGALYSRRRQSPATQNPPENTSAA